VTGFGIRVVGFLALWFPLRTYGCMQYVLNINPDSSNQVTGGITTKNAERNYV
jgi:hypothetical protein